MCSRYLILFQYPQITFYQMISGYPLLFGTLGLFISICVCSCLLCGCSRSDEEYDIIYDTSTPIISSNARSSSYQEIQIVSSTSQV